MCNAKALKNVLIAGLVLVSLGGLGFAYLAPPLIRSATYAVGYTSNNVSHDDAALFKPMTMSGLYYVHLPASGCKWCSWFGVDFRRHAAFVPVALYSSSLGFSYIHRDQANGVNLLSHKAGDWTVEFSDAGVVFSGEGLVVRFQK